MTESDKKIATESLKVVREKLGLSINDISLSTKINPRILKAIEDGDKAALPPKSFARGFIRSYATYLKIDPAPIIASFEFQEEPTAKEINVNPDVKKDAKKSSSGQLLDTSKAIVIGVLILLIATIFGIKQIVDKYAKEGIVVPASDISAINSEPELNTQNPEDDAGTIKKTTDEIKPNDSTATAASAEQTSAATTSAPATPASVAATPPVSTTTNSSDKKDVAVVAPTTTKPVEASTKTTPEQAPDAKPAAPAPAKMQEIILEALDKVDITIEIENGKTETITLQPEQIHTIKARGKITLDISDGGTVGIIHNGREVNNTGDLGKPKKITFP